MDKDIASGILSVGVCRGDIPGVWIGKAQREVKPAVRIAAVDEVPTLRRSPVTFPSLMAHRRETKSDFVAAQDPVIVHEHHATLLFQDHDSGHFGPAVRADQRTATKRQNKHQE